MESRERVHFIGIGGISMSGIAEILINKGYSVSGSDMKDSHLLNKLRGKGAEIFVGHSSNNIKDADIVVVSSAIPETNPELKHARDNGLTILKRAEMIARLMKEQKGIAISGTHGKTTTTSMTASLLMEGSKDPTILVGGELDIINGNAYLGQGEYLLTEADESDGSFLYYNPEIVVVTNIEMDHQDFYNSEEKLFRNFHDFIMGIPNDGKAIVCAEDENIMTIIDSSDSRIITYGIDCGQIQAGECKLFPFGSIYRLLINDQEIAKINLKIPGRHNVLNSLAAIAVAIQTGMSAEEIKSGIEKYAGVHRRFEKKGLLGDILIIDDYAHHPTEIEATLKVAKNTGYERIIAIYQPHRFTRTQHLMNSFNNTFNDVDHLIITDIYSAGEDPIPGVSAEKLSKIIAKNNSFPVDFIADKSDVVKCLTKIARSKDLIITIGAGDVYKIGELFINDMKKKLEKWPEERGI